MRKNGAVKIRSRFCFDVIGTVKCKKLTRGNVINGTEKSKYLTHIYGPEKVKNLTQVTGTEKCKKLTEGKDIKKPAGKRAI